MEPTANNEMEHISRMNRGIEQERKALLETNYMLEKQLEENRRKLRELSVQYSQNFDRYVEISKNLREAGKSKTRKN